MMIKKLIRIFVLCLALMPLSVSQVVAQSNETNEEVELSEDSVVSVIAFFNKNDTLTYRYDFQETRAVEGDTVLLQSLSRNISIVVTDSTENGYTLEMIAENIDDDEGNERSLSEIEFFKSIKGEKVIVQLDEYGTLKGISNRKALCDKAKAALNNTFGNKNIDKDTAKNLKRMVEQTLNSEEGIMGMFPELDLLFGSHGIQVQIGENNVVDSTSSEIPVTYKYIADNDYNEDGSYAGYFTMVLMETIIPKEKFSGQLAKGLSSMGFGKEKKLAGTLGDFFDKELKDDVNIRGYESREYYPIGWPKKTVTMKESDMGNIMNVKARRITCTSYSLYNF